jgi:hypothetical protein
MPDDACHALAPEPWRVSLIAHVPDRNPPNQRGNQPDPVSAIRRNPPIKAHYQQLTARGRPKMVAIVACMRRLLAMLNAIIRTQSPWRDA